MNIPQDAACSYREPNVNKRAQQAAPVYIMHGVNRFDYLPIFFSRLFLSARYNFGDLFLTKPFNRLYIFDFLSDHQTKNFLGVNGPVNTKS